MYKINGNLSKETYSALQHFFQENKEFLGRHPSPKQLLTNLAAAIDDLSNHDHQMSNLEWIDTLTLYIQGQKTSVYHFPDKMRDIFLHIEAVSHKMLAEMDNLS